MSFDPARPDGTNGSASGVLAPDGVLVPGQVYTIPAREGRAFRLSAGQRLRVANPFGTQVGDFWAFNAANLREHLSMEHLRPALRRVVPRPGDALVTNLRRPILTMLADTSPGVHDTLVASCDVHRYGQLGHQGYHDNCTDNLRMALAAIGLQAPDVPCPFNLWMNTPFDADGAMRWLEPASRAGDRVDFRAEMDAVVVISCCPMDLLPINGADAVIRPLEVRVD
jgi:uncharacterized protein YcgI (DUF1989 family)